MVALVLPDIGIGILFCLYLTLTPDVLQQAQSVPWPSPFCFEWPRYLISLLSHKNPPPAQDWPSTLINVKSGYARTNRSAAIEHLLQHHASSPTRQGLTLTFLYTSEPPKYPRGDWFAVGTMLLQLIVVWALRRAGIASQNLLTVTAAGTWLSFYSGLVLLYQWKRDLRTIRAVSAGEREVVGIVNGNGSTDAVVVITDGGGAKLEDMAGGGVGRLGTACTVAVVLLLLCWLVLLAGFTLLDAADAVCTLGLAALGTLHALYRARTWHSAEALGFTFADERTTVVHDENVMQALMRAEEVECGVGLALLSVYFPGPLRIKEEEYWDARKKMKNAG